MKAIIQTSYGSIDDLELRDVAEPTAGEREVLVRVRASSVHPDVWHVVRGRPYVLRRPALIALSPLVKQLRGPGLPPPMRQDAMAVLADLLQAGKLTPIIDRSYPLADAQGTLRHMVQDDLHGKVVITV